MMRREDYREISKLILLAVEEADHGKDNRPTLQQALISLENQQIKKVAR